MDYGITPISCIGVFDLIACGGYQKAPEIPAYPLGLQNSNILILLLLRMWVCG